MSRADPPTQPQSDRRIVVTGIGVVAPGAVGAHAFADALKGGRSAVGPLTRFDASALPCRLAGEAPADAVEPVPPNLDRSIHYALVAAREAVADSGLTHDDLSSAAAVIGATKAGPAVFERACQEQPAGDATADAAAIVHNLADGAARAVVTDLGLRGPWTALGAACATGAYCLIRAAELIRAGRCDAALAGSADAPLVPSLFASFANLAGLMTTRNERGATAVRPFCATRDGLVIGEGAAVLVLEDLDHARARNADIYADLAGWGRGGEACHMTALPAEPNVPVRVIRQALDAARLNADELSYVSAHGTATRRNDPYETLAYKAALGDAASRVPISSIKAMLGHCMVASASIEAAACLLAMRHSFVPPTINYHEPDPACDLDWVPNEVREARLDAVLSLSLGFGGHVAALVFRGV